MMTTPRPTVRLATVDDSEPIADLLADAFLDYEWSRWAVPVDNRRERLRGLHLLYAGLVGAEAGSTWVTDDISSVAAWVKPGRTPISDALRTRLNEESAELFGDRLEAVDALDAETAPLSAPPGLTGTSQPSARDLTAGAKAWPRSSSALAWTPATSPGSRRRSRPRTRRTAASTSAWASGPRATGPRPTAGCASGSWSGRLVAGQPTTHE